MYGKSRLLHVVRNDGYMDTMSLRVKRSNLICCDNCMDRQRDFPYTLLNTVVIDKKSFILKEIYLYAIIKNKICSIIKRKDVDIHIGSERRWNIFTFQIKYLK